MENEIKPLEPLVMIGTPKIGRSDFYAPSHTPTIVGVQFQTEQAQHLLMHQIKMRRQYIPEPLPLIYSRKPDRSGTIWIRRLKRKSSRRWHKKWEKRGLKIDTNKILKLVEKRIKAARDKTYRQLFLGVYTNEE